jgi:molybdopterin-binding protein
MKISARNQMKGVITAVRPGATTTHVEIDIGTGVVTAAITNEAAQEMKLVAGQHAYAVIKASDVMIGID